MAGQCRPIAGADSAMVGAPQDGAGAHDLAQSPPGEGGVADFALPPDGGAPACSFNGDGVIERAEEPFVVGLGGLFAVNAAGSPVSMSETPVGGAWDFSAPVPGERKVFDELLGAPGSWWAADFPGATYAERIDDGAALLGVFRVRPDGLDLLGVVSDMGGLTRTELTYATPIPVLKFPLQKGTAWTAESDVSGVASGILFAAHEKYAFTVDARGSTRVPAGSFDTLRLRMDYTQTYGLLVTTRFQYLHLSECYGSVARVRSRDNEPKPDFTTAAEFRRLSTP